LSLKIIHARSGGELADVRSLFREYEAFLQVDLSFQAFEAELTGLPGRYASPEGALLLAMRGGYAVGCVAMRRQMPGTCEMKRLFVRPAYRKQGIGRILATAIIHEARKAGYERMVLDTLDHLGEAMGLYESLGFQRCLPYYENPLPGAIYWKRHLK
jgi:ribosomal protein S18 acetylase RimI-like enzyme